jgi:L-serine/L-threonine ammonia-lyase
LGGLPPLHIETPLVESRRLSERAGRTILLKFESLQPSGSFKTRGIGHICQVEHAHGARRFLTSSGGNAGLAVAYAGRRLGVPVTVVVPQATSARARELMALEGAQVVVHGASWQEANQHAQTMLSAADTFIHPFDHPAIWEGHATLVDEVVGAGARPDAVVLSVGGGGLLSGVALGLERHHLGDVPIIAVETEGAASFRAAVSAGQPVDLPAITSIATTLGARRVCDRALQWAQERPIESVVVPDAAAVAACRRFLDDHRVLVEPACGASLAIVYDQADALQAFRNVLVIVCGGATTTIAQLEEWSRVDRAARATHP